MDLAPCDLVSVPLDDPSSYLLSDTLDLAEHFLSTPSLGVQGNR